MPKLAEIAGIGKKGGGDGYVAPSLTIISATPTSGGTIQEGQTLTVTLGGAGIYEGDKFCLITEKAKENIIEIHHRQPVIINQIDINRYLNLEIQGSTFLKECNKPDLIFHEVSKDVNKPTNNSASLIQPV